MTRTFASKVDAWLAIAAIGPGLLILPWVGVLLWREGELLTLTGILTMAPVCLIGMGLPLWIFLGTRYEITPHTLRVRSGPLKQEVPLDAIEHIATSGSWGSAPALSLKRLRVTMRGGRTVLISPADQRGFLAALAQAGVAAARGVSPSD
jgi:hypothetical protein